MTIQERSLYHQIHPLKLFTDWSTGLAALYLLWGHHLVAGLALAFIPSIAVSLAIMRFANLEKYQRSSFGQYIGRYMTRTAEGARLAGYGIMAVGTWYRLTRLIPFGFLVILAAWLYGLVLPAPTEERNGVFAFGRSPAPDSPNEEILK